MEIERIKNLLYSDFELELFEASLRNLRDNQNKLRFNNFAYSIRELSRHIQHNLAPDEEVINCVWYRNETGDVGKLSRGERVKYAIQGGLTNNFVDTEILELEIIN